MSELSLRIMRQYERAGPQQRAGAWVMDRAWYDKLRAACCTEDQEQARAREHARVWIRDGAQAPRLCPACLDGPFAGMADLLAHLSALADPDYREPDPRDQLMGIAVRVRPGGGEPHLEAAPGGWRPGQ